MPGKITQLQKMRGFMRRFRERYSLRIHMCAILLATAGSGALASKLLLLVHVENFTIRYPLAVLFSYLVFFACIKLWLVYVTPGADSGSGSSFVDGSDIPITGYGGGSGSGNVASFSGSGGEFAGGGASGDFDIGSDAATEGIASAAVSDASSGAAEGVGDVVGGVGDALGDDGGVAAIVVIAVLAILLLAVLGASVYVIYQAPMILSEAALQGVLAASLTKHTKAMAQSDWVGSVFKATWKPFACMLLVALMCGAVLHTYFPAAVRLADVWK
jgi:hypothetical protein